MDKFNAGKSSILVFTVVFAIFAFLLGSKITTVSAAQNCNGGNRDNGCSCNNNNQCSSNKCSSFVCVPQSTPTPTPTATPTHTPTPTPTATPLVCDPGFHVEGNQCVHNGGGQGNCDQDQGHGNNGQDNGNTNCATATPTSTPTPVATATPTATPGDPCGDHPTDACSTPTPVATATPTSNNNGGNDGGDGLGCATHDCSGNHVAAPQGQVLGASTMAGTGSFDEMFYQAIMTVGATLSAFGIKGLKKAKKVSKK